MAARARTLNASEIEKNDAERDYLRAINAKTTKAFIRRNWQRRDWWLTAESCLKHGFVDAVR